MHKLYELKEMLCRELEDYGSKDRLDAASLDVVDKLAHAIKNIDRVISENEDGYGMSHRRSRAMYPGTDIADGVSYARGRGRGARRDALGRYSRADGEMTNEELVTELHGLMDDVRDERTKDELRHVIRRLGNM